MSAADSEPVYTVGGLLAALRGLIEERVGRVWVVGEVSNLHRAGSGHSYFTLKDEAGQIRAALFRNAARRLSFEPEDGLEVLVHGDISIYEARGDLQIIVRHLEPRGEGALRLAFEQLRRRLEAEGLFDLGRKRTPPAVPSRIGVVASLTSAAIRDVLQVTGRRCPGIPILISSTRVQGDGAEREIAAALDALATAGDVDCILLVRGGGSLEDLHAFNTEVVARAIVRSRVPVICGVGHEVDVTIADLVADVRAPTPSAAAELIAPDRSILHRGLERDWRRLERAMATTLERTEARLVRERDALKALSPSARLSSQRSQLAVLVRELRALAEARLSSDRARLELPLRSVSRDVAARLADDRERFASLWPALAPAIGRLGDDRRGRLAELSGRLEALSPLAVLSRGYAIVQRRQDGAIVRRAEDLEVGERIAVRVAEAELDAVVQAVRTLAVV